MQQKNLYTPKVYVGTYKKYNNGSIAGGWVDLAACVSYEGFLAACKKLHSDEHDPEYMIQDHEYLPDGLACGEWISSEEFNDILTAWKEENEPSSTGESEPVSDVEIIDYSERSIFVTGEGTRAIKDELMALHGKWNRYKKGYFFSKKYWEDVKSLLAGRPAVSATHTSKAKKRDFVDALEEYLLTKSEDWRGYYKKKTLCAVKLSDDTFFVVEKGSIDNTFCFHDEGPDYEFYKELTSDEEKLKKYFLRENLRDYGMRTLLDEDDQEDAGAKVWVDCYNDNECVVRKYNEHAYPYCNNIPDKHREATPEEARQVKAACQYGRDTFEKQLHTYLKRYGTSKIRTWTYWADR